MQVPLEWMNFEEFIDSEECEKTFMEEYKEYLSNSRQRLFRKMKANQQKILDNKEKCRQLDLKLLKQEELREKVRLDIQTYRKEYQLAIEHKNNLKDEIEKARKENPELVMKLADINREIKQKNEDMKYEWAAIVKACNIYKKYLNIHIKMDKFDDVYQIQVTHFFNENPDKTNYYVILLKQNNKWKVNKIVPALKPEDQKSLDVLPHEMENIHVTILLWKLRMIFLNYKRLS